jgi:hypothetical protein
VLSAVEGNERESVFLKTRIGGAETCDDRGVNHPGGVVTFAVVFGLTVSVCSCGGSTRRAGGSVKTAAPVNLDGAPSATAVLRALGIKIVFPKDPNQPGSADNPYAARWYAVGTTKGEEVDVFTYKSNESRDDDKTEVRSDPASTLPKLLVAHEQDIQTDRTLVSVTGVLDPRTGAVMFPLSSDVIAKRIGGRLVPPQ